MADQHFSDSWATPISFLCPECQYQSVKVGLFNCLLKSHAGNGNFLSETFHFLNLKPLQRDRVVLDALSCSSPIHIPISRAFSTSGIQSQTSSSLGSKVISLICLHRLSLLSRRCSSEEWHGFQTGDHNGCKFDPCRSALIWGFDEWLRRK